MRKLLLASNGGFLFAKGYGLLGIPLDQMKVAYITTASKGATSLEYLDQHKQAMEDAGINYEEIDIEGKSAEDLEKLLATKNVMHVEGGNAFYLLKALKENGADNLLIKLIDQGMIYVGTSAGTYIACPTIDPATWKSQDKDRYGLTDFTALNLVPFLITAHYIDANKDLIKNEIQKSTYPVRILKDGQGILVEDSKYTFVGSGEEVISND
ncbi:MAG: Type 1 glutamine amidotransferase-like domain-containing protein [Patescibacteria group bacterium]|nr:Type 1 glutamine amidotransferase-like domain-containing protein [Patescibacteria group bacterium]